MENNSFFALRDNKLEKHFYKIKIGTPTKRRTRIELFMETYSTRVHTIYLFYICLTIITIIYQSYYFD